MPGTDRTCKLVWNADRQEHSWHFHWSCTDPTCESSQCTRFRAEGHPTSAHARLAAATDRRDLRIRAAAAEHEAAILSLGVTGLGQTPRNTVVAVADVIASHQQHGIASARGSATAHRSNDGCSCGLVRFWTLEHVAEELVHAGLIQATPGAPR